MINGDSAIAFDDRAPGRSDCLAGRCQARSGPGNAEKVERYLCRASPRLHEAFFAAIGEPLENADPSDRLLDVETQLGWLRELGFDDVDCYWKWLEIALLLGVKPG